MDLKEELNKNKSFQKLLYAKGFLITNKKDIDGNIYPFFGNWKKTQLFDFDFWIDSRVNLFVKDCKDGKLFLIGHAYNPFTMEYNEIDILESLTKKLEDNNDYLDYINELTGIFLLGFVSDKGFKLVLDASGMQYACYGTINGFQVVTSHMRILEDLFDIQTSKYVKSLISYKFYPLMMGNYLPGDLTCYEGINRIIPNTFVNYDMKAGYTITRFYPNSKIQMCDNEKDYDSVIKTAAEILSNTMQLIAQKWKEPAISLTGGIDSNTTFAAANGFYDRYKTFSYVSMYRESVDAEKAREISERFNVPFKEYDIPNENSEINNFDIYKAVLERNGGDIGHSKDNDIRKKAFLIENNVCEVEVKSWISETIRAYAYKYFGRSKFKKILSPRDFTCLYKILLNRKLVRQTDNYFDDYMKKTHFHESMFNYDESDFFVWEMMHGGKCGLDIGVMKTCFDITIPYNNRKLLDILLRVPLIKRISDQHHLDLKKILNKELYDMGIRVINLNETKKRKMLINLYYKINSHLPF